MLELYGIPNCDTVKQARLWLNQAGLTHTFHDFKKTGVAAELLEHWAGLVGWERLLNRRGSTWRQLSPATQQAASDETSALALMRARPSLIKRPVASWPDGTVTVGFIAEDWHRLLPKFLPGFVNQTGPSCVNLRR
ncbi:MAG: arsenate reductase [Betaproteobacteria bacterium]|nr:arsenate reductase [Betaproteobacteria bacterium]